MEQIKLDVYRGVVHELFIRWDSLKLAVEHMGGRQGQQVNKAFSIQIFKSHSILWLEHAFFVTLLPNNSIPPIHINISDSP